MDQICSRTHLRVPSSLQELWLDCYEYWCPLPFDQWEKLIFREPYYQGDVAYTREWESLNDAYYDYIHHRGRIFLRSYLCFWPPWDPDGDNEIDISKIVEKDVQYEPVLVSREYAQTFANSTQVSFGRDGCVREDTSHAVLPIVKIAHPNGPARQRVSNEFEVYRKMSGHSLPIAQVGAEPLSDSQGIFGFRMERLYRLCSGTNEENFLYHDEVKEVVQRVNKAGFAIGDLMGSNVMRYKNGEMTLIDFTFGGRIGDKIPQYLQKRNENESEVFNAEHDMWRVWFRFTREGVKSEWIGDKRKKYLSYLQGQQS